MGHVAIVGTADGRRNVDVSTVAESEHRFGAGLVPSHRMFELFRDTGDEAILGVEAALAAKGTPDIGCHDPYLVWVEVEQLRQVVSSPVSALGATPLGELIASRAVGLPMRDRRPGFDRGDTHPRDEKLLADRHVAVGEELGIVFGLDLKDDVRSRVDVHEGRVGYCVGGGDDRVEQVVVDEHHLGCVHALLAGRRDDRGHRFTDVSDNIDRQIGAEHVLVERPKEGRCSLEFKLGCIEHGDDAGHGLGVG